MNQILWLIVLSTAWFLVLLGLKGALRIKFCVACVTVSTSWLSLLALKLIGYSVDPVLIGILMGQSIVGVYYLLEKHLQEKWMIFRWPYLISATAITYLVIDGTEKVLSVLMAIAIVWILFGSVFIFRNFPQFKLMADKLIACCRDW